jgi:hypothetical protein
MKSMLRPIAALVGGYVAWVAAFWAPMFLMAFVWPALRGTARVFFEQQRYDVFDTSMLIAFQFVWLFANGSAGFVVRWIGKRPLELRWFAVLLFLYFAYNHLWALWDQLPAWYNVLVVIPVMPMVLIGGTLEARWLGPRSSTVWAR